MLLSPKLSQTNPRLGRDMAPVALSETDGLPIRESGPWIKRKYHYLERYIDIFTVGMSKKWPLTFVDLFAGPGRCLITETGEEVNGSALIALKYNFNNYIFDALQKRCNQTGKSSQIQFFNSDCNKIPAQIVP